MGVNTTGPAIVRFVIVVMVVVTIGDAARRRRAVTGARRRGRPRARLRALPVPRPVRRRMAVAVGADRIGPIWSAWLVGVVVMATVATLRTSWPVSVAVVGAAIGGGRAALGLLGNKRAAAFEAALPLFADSTARALRAGLSLTAAITEASASIGGPIAEDAAEVVRAAGIVGVDAALADWATRRALPSVRLLAGALRLGARVGGSPGAALEAVAETLRERLGVHAETKALTAQAQASALVMIGAPVVFCALLTLSDARASAFLLQTPFGLGCLGAGLLLDALGGAWMRRLVRRVAS